MNNRRGQVAIFVIVAILIVGGVMLFFWISGNRAPGVSSGEAFDPENFIDKCIRDSLRETIDTMLPQGGFVNPQDYKIYQDTKIAYLCKNINYYDPCITQHPRLIKTLEEEIISNTKETIEGCFIQIEDELRNRGYSVSGSNEIVPEVVLKPDVVTYKIDRQLNFNKNEDSRSIDSFSASVRIPLYDIGKVAQTIVAQEAQFCYFEYVGYMNLYPRWDIRKWTMSDSTSIYTIKDRPSGATMNIAIRGCAIPAGF